MRFSRLLAIAVSAALVLSVTASAAAAPPKWHVDAWITGATPGEPSGDCTFAAYMSWSGFKDGNYTAKVEFAMDGVANIVESSSLSVTGGTGSWTTPDIVRTVNASPHAWVAWASLWSTGRHVRLLARSYSGSMSLYCV
jgi:hypothetical protein